MTHPDWNWTIGEIVAPFGRSGEVKVRMETDFPERFWHLSQVCLRGVSGEARLFRVEGVRLHKGQALLKLEGVHSISDAEALRQMRVQIRRQDAIALEENEFYIHDLIGCVVETPEGTRLGLLTGVLRGGAHDVYVIGEGKEEILLPAIRDVVRHVDIATKRIVVTPTPGLLPGEAEVVL